MSKKSSKAKLKAISADDQFPGADVTIGGLKIDLDAKEWPDEIEDAALSSGGYPYDKKLKRKVYDSELRALQIELLKLQAWAHKTGARIAILFEGRDSAGKGGTIKRFTEHLNPRSARVVALPKPSDVERGQFYFQRYVAELPSAGEIAFFDRSWYNRAVVEPVMGFCTPEQTAQFLKDAPVFEKMLVDNGVHLIKFWLTVGREMQVKRLFDRRHDPLKHWKLSAIDYQGLPLWDAYTEAARTMLEATHTEDGPWTVVRANGKRRLRLEAIRFVLSKIAYEGRDAAIVGVPDHKIVADAASFLTKGGQI